MKSIIKSLFFILISFYSFSQVNQMNSNSIGFEICSNLSIKNFSDNKQANSALEEILSVIGASKRFVLQPCNNVPNAAALTLLGVRYIYYNPEWMSNLKYSNDWVNYFILAHEVGHHINNHTIDAALRLNGQLKGSSNLSASRIEELEADEFAGFVLGRLGATLEESLLATKNFANGDDSFSSHPNRDKRVNAIKKGFNNSGGKKSKNIESENNGIMDSPYSNMRFSNVRFSSYTTSDGIYRGFVSKTDGKPFGFGTFNWNNGMVYEGEYNGGLPNGFGKLTTSDGTSFEGNWVNGIFSGNGILKNPERGISYIGNFSNGELNGNGKIIHSDSISLEGTFNEGRIIKVVARNSNNDKEIQIGFLDNSGGNGLTTFTYDTGTKLTGEFYKNGKLKPSRGILGGVEGIKGYIGLKKDKDLNKAILKKTFQAEMAYFYPYDIFPEIKFDAFSCDKFYPEDKLEGKMIFNFSKGEYALAEGFEKYNSSYNQNLYKDYLNKFTYPFDNYSVDIYYSGELLSKVKIEHPNGEIYTGYVLVPINQNYIPEDNRFGYGELVYSKDAPEEKYYGMFINNKMHGFGVLQLKNGELKKGIFKNNEFVKPYDFDLKYLQFSMKGN